jgi:peptide/bleomycin uptake transporter
MFVSFFPRPKLFFLSAVLWIAFSIGLWFLFAKDFGAVVGFPPVDPEKPPIVGIQIFWSRPFLWFYFYYAAITAAFAAFWQFVAPHPWWKWSILGTSLIIFNTFIDVQVSVATNNWRGPFFDMVQGAFAKTAPITLSQYYMPMLDLGLIFMANIFLATLNLFFVSHWVFRWRSAMNDFYIERWDRLRKIEGASQRVQEDTMRFATIVETLGVAAVTSIMTLIAFLPVLHRLSASVPELPLIGAVPSSLVTVAFIWAIIGTVWLAAIGIKLPGLNFKNQRVEAAYRKELVLGEDHADRADPISLRELYNNVRTNYFRMYFHYLYFNIGRYFYLQLNSLLVMVLIGPAIVAGRLTMGLWQQILTAFDQVQSSFLYLVNSWTTIIELISIHKRLEAFEATLKDKPLSDIEAEPAV